MHITRMSNIIDMMDKPVWLRGELKEWWDDLVAEYWLLGWCFVRVAPGWWRIQSGYYHDGYWPDNKYDIRDVTPQMVLFRLEQQLAFDFPVDIPQKEPN